MLKIEHELYQHVDFLQHVAGDPLEDILENVKSKAIFKNIDQINEKVCAIYFEPNHLIEFEVDTDYKRELTNLVNTLDLNQLKQAIMRIEAMKEEMD